jgi:hypothetical protein
VDAPRLALDDVVDPDNPHHHHSARLAASLIRLSEREQGRRHAAGVARSA